MSFRRRLKSEVIGATRFAGGLATVVAVGSVVAFHIEAWLAGAMTTTVAHVAVAGFMPTFLAGWLFYLYRRVAWRSPLAAFSVSTLLASGALLAHALMLGSSFYRVSPSWRLPLQWCDAVFVGAIFPRWSAGGWDPTPACAAAAIAIGVAFAVVQRAVVRRRNAP